MAIDQNHQGDDSDNQVKQLEQFRIAHHDSHPLFKEQRAVPKEARPLAQFRGPFTAHHEYGSAIDIIPQGLPLCNKKQTACLRGEAGGHFCVSE